MKKYIIFIASAVLMMTACAKEEINTATGETEFISVEFVATKTALNTDGKNTNWTTGDKVSVTVESKNLGTLEYVGDNKFEGEIGSVGLDGKLQATINYPAGKTTVPATQAAVAGSFADEAAFLEGTVTLANLRAGNGGELNNTTALLQFQVAQAGDVTFEVGTAKYTVTGCETGKTYYACVAPATNVSFVARIGGYLSKKASANKTFTENKKVVLGTLPAPQKASWNIKGSFTGGNNWSSDVPLYVYDENGNQAILNVDFGSGGAFKFYNTTNGWSGYNNGNDAGNGWKWISGGGGGDITASGKVDIYVNDSGWAFKVVSAGTSPF